MLNFNSDIRLTFTCRLPQHDWKTIDSDVNFNSDIKLTITCRLSQHDWKIIDSDVKPQFRHRTHHADCHNMTERLLTVMLNLNSDNKITITCRLSQHDWEIVDGDVKPQFRHRTHHADCHNMTERLLTLMLNLNLDTKLTITCRLSQHDWEIVDSDVKPQFRHHHMQTVTAWLKDYWQWC